MSALSFARSRPRLASADRAGLVLLWDLDHSGEGHPIGAASATAAVETLAWHPDDVALAAADAAGRVSLWQTDHKSQGHPGTAHARDPRRD